MVEPFEPGRYLNRVGRPRSLPIPSFILCSEISIAWIQFVEMIIAREGNNIDPIKLIVDVEKWIF